MSHVIGLLFRRLLTAVSGDSADDGSADDGQNADGGTFAGSLLDWSVNYGHQPGGRSEAAREMAQIQAKADMLDEQEHHRR